MRQRGSFFTALIQWFPVLATWFVVFFLVMSFLLDIFMGG